MHIIFSHLFYIFDFGNSPYYNITPDKIGNNENCMIQVFSNHLNSSVTNNFHGYKCTKSFIAPVINIKQCGDPGA